MTVEDRSADEEVREAAQKAPFAPVQGRSKGYAKHSVDEFLERARLDFEHGDDRDENSPLLTSSEIRRIAFPLERYGYSVAQVDAAMARIEDAFAVAERAKAVADAGAAEWVDSTRDLAQEVLDRLTRRSGHRFVRVSALRFGYRVDEVDLVADKLAAYLEHGGTVTAEQVRAVAFRMQRGGYREAQVDAVLDAVVEVMLAVR